MSSSEPSDFLSSEKTPEIAGYINFFLILDNSGNRIYCKYYTNELNTIEKQLEFEKKLCQITSTYSIDKSDLDIFIFDKYNILSRISGEAAIFIGQNESDNECLLEVIYNIFEEVLFNMIENSLTRESLLNNYDKVAMLIDEMINGGIVVNLDEKSLGLRVYEGKGKNKGKNNSVSMNSEEDSNKKGSNNNDNNSNKGGMFNGWFGFWK